MEQQTSRRVLCVGLCCADIINVCDHYPKEDTDQRSADYYWQRGGNASNSSSALALLGANVEFLGTLVRGREYKFLTDDFAAYGIHADQCPVYEESPGVKGAVAVIVINRQNGSRTIMAAINHVPELKMEHFQNIQLHNYRWIHFEGRQNIDEIEKMIQRVQEYNTSCNTDQRVSTSLEFEKPRLPGLGRLLDQVDYVFVSKDLAVSRGYQNKEEAARGFMHSCRPGGTVICAWGDDGAAAKTGSDDVITSPVYSPKTVVDTLAAGDTFNGATIFALSSGLDVGGAIRFGCMVAGTKCGMVGNKGIKGLQNQLDSFRTHQK
ncbi:ketohexokinase-like [Mya arenaria]|uniref:ketohexokinase-like n=1 Tax=Mya arenaria TaxID=6604 RepID=UPI0022E2B2FA|nr:ketohexokinase-like [Mya arenaria]XP_052801607.1 ketohexokinase-like [Mya arenaria]XP_052801608.1 ketohexokinase-like [Mya arenaria]XP_052801610.1 ketohexokinase-like [Mya arenaria]XP_052801611.1 ketohexokinase-like [Mya arenaria]